MSYVIDGEYRVRTLPNGNQVRELNTDSPILPIRLTRAEFMRRFPRAKRIAVRQRRHQGNQNYDAIIEDAFSLLEGAAWVEPSHPDLAEFCAYLVTNGLLTQQEAAAVMQPSLNAGESGP